MTKKTNLNLLDFYTKYRYIRFLLEKSLKEKFERCFVVYIIKEIKRELESILEYEISEEITFSNLKELSTLLEEYDFTLNAEDRVLGYNYIKFDYENSLFYQLDISPIFDSDEKLLPNIQFESEHVVSSMVCNIEEGKINLLPFKR